MFYCVRGGGEKTYEIGEFQTLHCYARLSSVFCSKEGRRRRSHGKRQRGVSNLREALNLYRTHTHIEEVSYVRKNARGQKHAIDGHEPRVRKSSLPSF